mmetsp:Transcript_7427/g.9662  ORF Transcript_7427/g.9662 Transcript_7427/m.9662 type:complete len:88 (+) Transcript_7427:96-359(+)
MDDPSGPCLAKALSDKTGQSSVPSIFIHGKHLGGNSDLQEAHTKGTLQLVSLLLLLLNMSTLEMFISRVERQRQTIDCVSSDRMDRI